MHYFIHPNHFGMCFAPPSIPDSCPTIAYIHFGKVGLTHLLSKKFLLDLPCRGVRAVRSPLTEELLTSAFASVKAGGVETPSPSSWTRQGTTTATFDVCKSHVRLCVAWRVPVSIMLITSARKLPVGGRCSLKKILHARSLPVGQSCCSVAIWGAQGLEKCRFSDTKIVCFHSSWQNID